MSSGVGFCRVGGSCAYSLAQHSLFRGCSVSSFLQKVALLQIVCALKQLIGVPGKWEAVAARAEAGRDRCGEGGGEVGGGGNGRRGEGSRVVKQGD